MNCQEPEIEVEIVPVKQQTNETNCGVFAIAFAISLACMEDLSLINYDENNMRQHLVKCIKMGKLERFPRLPSVPKEMSRRKVVSIELFCTCRMPYDAHEMKRDEAKRYGSL